MTLTQIKPAGLSKPVDFADNERIRLGTGNDLQIWHDGTNSRLNSATNMFNIQSDDFRVTDAANSLTAFRIDPDGATDLRYNGSAKLQTTSTGVDILGSDTTGSNLNGDLVINNAAGTRYAVFDASHTKLNFSDNASITLGNSNDLQIYHSGSHSYIKDSGTGALLVLSNQFAVQNAAGTETIMNMVENGSVDLYYDDSKKFETTSDGIKVGSVTIDSTYNNIGLPDNGQLRFGAGEDLRIYSNGARAYIDHVTAGTGSDLFLRTKTFVVANYHANDELMIVGNQNGGVQLYYDNSKKFETTSYGCLVTGNLGFADNDKAVFGAGSDLQIYHDGSDSIIKGTGTGSLILESAVTNEHTLVKAGVNGDFRAYVNNGTLALICNAATQNAELRCGGNTKFETLTTGAKVTGHLGVNREPSTSHPLRVEGSNQYIAGLTNTSASSSYFPWLLHKSINSLQAFGVHFNGLSGDPFHVDQNGAIYLGKQTATANALDDYEIGTWTPSFAGSSSNPTQSYTTQNGTYVKVGNFVHCEFDVKVASSGISGGSGFLYVTGVPFAKSSVLQTYGIPASFGYSDNLSTSHPTAAYMAQAQSFIYLMSTTTADGNNYSDAAHITNNSRVLGGFTFRTDS